MPEQAAPERPTNVPIVVPSPPIDVTFPCCPGCKVLNEPVTKLVPIEEEHPVNLCQGITPSNSKGGLPAPEAGARTQEGGVRAKIDLAPSRSGDSQDKAEPQTAELTQLPEVVEGRVRPGGPT